MDLTTHLRVSVHGLDYPFKSVYAMNFKRICIIDVIELLPVAQATYMLDLLRRRTNPTTMCVCM